MSDKALSVSQFIHGIKSQLEGNFQNVLVEGEVSNLSRSGAGHWYFSLSDKDATISVALFKMDALRNPLIQKLKDGDQLQCFGSVGVYAKRGSFQIIVKKVFPVGKGSILQQFEELKNKLQAQGMFESKYKKNIPKFPQKVAVITAEQGAALHDFINVFTRRSLWMDLLLVPAVVQGAGAPLSIMQAMGSILKYNKENTDTAIDLVVLTRGGGSMEDLWAFNDEGLAYEIFQYPLPIISAVGHQVDFTIADFVADYRCETPTAAAETITQEQVQLKGKILHLKKSLMQNMKQQFSDCQYRMESGSPSQNIEKIWGQYYQFEKRLNQCAISQREMELIGLPEKNYLCDDLIQKINQIIKDRYESHLSEATKQHKVLLALNPQNVLKRGFSYIKSDEGKVVSSKKSFDKLKRGMKLDIQFYDGHGKVNKEI